MPHSRVPSNTSSQLFHQLRVKLIQAVQLPPRKDVKVSVQVENNQLCGPVLIARLYLPDGISLTESLIVAPGMKQTEVVLTNPTGVT